MRIILIAAAVVVVAGRYLREWQRLALVRRLPGPEARDRYEAGRKAGDLALAAGTAVLAVAAAAVSLRVWLP